MKCSICDCEFEEELDGGFEDAYIGMLEVAFCGMCLSGIIDMMGYLEKKRYIKKNE